MHEPYLRLIERLLPAMPHPSLDSFFFWNSGSEAVEAAIKMARAFTKKQNIISMQGLWIPCFELTFSSFYFCWSSTISRCISWTYIWGDGPNQEQDYLLSWFVSSHGTSVPIAMPALS